MKLCARSLPSIDVSPLFGPATAARDLVDRRIIAAAADVGFMTITGLPQDIRFDADTRRRLLRLFDAPGEVVAPLSSNRRDPSRPLIYRGWIERRPDRAYHYDAMEIGPDIAHGPGVLHPSDPLRGPTPMPAEADLPGWRAAVTGYFRGMERGADAVVRAIERGLGVPEACFSRLFERGHSALRLLCYPVRSASLRAQVDESELYVCHGGARREVVNEAHVDYGFMTLLAQDAVAGLQVRLADDTWIDVPPAEGQLVVNFGTLLERWTSGRVRATEHRVLSTGRTRFSLPFFYEPRPDVEIAPLPLADAVPFVPFRYGDYVWDSNPRMQRLFGGSRLAPTPS